MLILKSQRSGAKDPRFRAEDPATST